MIILFAANNSNDGRNIFEILLSLFIFFFLIIPVPGINKPITDDATRNEDWIESVSWSHRHINKRRKDQQVKKWPMRSTRFYNAFKDENF